MSKLIKSSSEILTPKIVKPPIVYSTLPIDIKQPTTHHGDLRQFRQPAKSHYQALPKAAADAHYASASVRAQKEALDSVQLARGGAKSAPASLPTLKSTAIMHTNPPEVVNGVNKVGDNVAKELAGGKESVVSGLQKEADSMSPARKSFFQKHKFALGYALGVAGSILGVFVITPLIFPGDTQEEEAGFDVRPGTPEERQKRIADLYSRLESGEISAEEFVMVFDQLINELNAANIPVSNELLNVVNTMKSNLTVIDNNKQAILENRVLASDLLNQTNLQTNNNQNLQTNNNQNLADIPFLETSTGIAVMIGGGLLLLAIIIVVMMAIKNKK